MKSMRQNSNQCIFPVYVLGIRAALQMFNTSTFSKYGVDDTHPNVEHPFCKEHVYGTDVFWECFVRHFTFTSYHPTSTCKMGGRDSHKSVVDQELRYLFIQ